MANEETVKRCKYCGCKINDRNTMCSTCRVKLKLVRKLLSMVKQAKERVDNG